MKTILRKIIVPTACMASLTVGCLFAAPPCSGGGSGGFLLGAPGVVTGSLVETVAPFSTTKDLGKFYKYIYRGMETKGAGEGAAGKSGDANGGILNLFTGVNGADLKSVGFDSEAAYNSSAVRSYYLANPVTYREENITVNWKANGNAKAPNGYFVILGEGIRDPKEPKGTLDVKSFALVGTTFQLQWNVTRDY